MLNNGKPTIPNQDSMSGQGFVLVNIGQKTGFIRIKRVYIKIKTDAGVRIIDNSIGQIGLNERINLAQK